MSNNNEGSRYDKRPWHDCGGSTGADGHVKTE